MKSKERKSIHPVSKVSESDEEYLYTVRSNQTPKVNVKVCQHWFKATVDTGATINVVDQETFAKMVKPDLKKTSIKAFAFYAKSPVRFVGKFEATIETRNSQTCNSRNVLCNQNNHQWKSDPRYYGLRPRTNQSTFAQDIGHER